MSTEAIAPVLTAQGWALLNSLDRYRAEDALALNERLRQAGYDADTIAAVLTQSRLRAKAERKFGEFAQRMIFTAAGLEQATRLPVAARHAGRFVAAGVKNIADLGCGIGADAMAFASLDLDVCAVERDETTAACATVNLMPFDNAQVRHDDATTTDLDGFDAVWLDPARRHTDSSGTRKLFDPESFEPPLSFVSALADRHIPLGVKLGPALPHDSLPENCEAQWLSYDGEALEVALWFNAVSRPGIRRSALVLRTGHTGLEATEITSPVAYDAKNQDPPLGPVDAYLYEPDAAVIRAGLVADTARLLGAHLLDPHIAYLSSPQRIDSALCRGFRVTEVLPYNLKQLKAWVREHGIEILEIKKRGSDVTPEELRQLLLGSAKRKTAKSTGAEAKKDTKSATLLLTRIGNKRIVAVAEPLETAPNI